MSCRGRRVNDAAPRDQQGDPTCLGEEVTTTGRARLTRVAFVEAKAGHLDGVDVATAPARWLLDAGVDGIPLTQTHALARKVVREAAELWPDWWHAELFGPPHREADLALLGELHEGLRRLKLVRRRGRKLYSTPRGRQLAGDPTALLRLLATDLGAGDPFTQAVAETVTEALAAGDRQDRDSLTAAALARVRRERWCDSDGGLPDEREVAWVVAGVLRRGKAYGLIEWPFLRARLDDDEDHFSLSEGALQVFGANTIGVEGTDLYVFEADLLDAPDVHARLAVRADQHLTSLHDAIQEAFGWYDDHLYSFWLDGRFWGDKKSEITAPVTPDDAERTADLPIAELDLAIGTRIAYVFDFGDEWRVMLTLRERTQSDAGTYPRVLGRAGTPPPQYPVLDD